MLETTCLLQDPDVLRANWRFVRVTAKFKDSQGRARNVEVRVVLSQGTIVKMVQANCLKRHVSNLVVLIVPIEDQAKNEDEHLDAEDGTSENIEKLDGRAKSTDEHVVEESSENEAKDVDRSSNTKVEDGSKFEMEIEAIDLKVMQHLPMMPHFGGECKTTGLVKVTSSSHLGSRNWNFER